MRASRRDSERPWRQDGVSAGSSTVVRDGSGCRGHSQAQAPSSYEWNEIEDNVVDTLERFPLVWCPTCDKTQKMIFDVMNAGGKNDHDAADIVCGHCATLHAPRTHKASARPKRAAKA